MEMPTIADLRQAHDRIRPFVHRTPVLTSTFFDERAGAKVFFKCENFQKVGAFKYRGATHAIGRMLPDARRSGVVTHSSGNHGAAVALAARRAGIQAHVVMPRTAPAIKRAAVAGYGATVHLCEPTLADRQATADKVVAQTGAFFVHPFNDPRIIAGQGTAVLELWEQAGPLDAVLAPVGGGGLLSGTALAVKGISSVAQVFGGEPAGADDAYRSMLEGRMIPSVDPTTVCDALLTSLGELTYRIIRDHVDEILTVSDNQAIDAMRQVLERMKILVEVSSAVPVAALLAHHERFCGQRVGIILSGGNVSLDTLPWLGR